MRKFFFTILFIFYFGYSFPQIAEFPVFPDSSLLTENDIKLTDSILNLYQKALTDTQKFAYLRFLIDNLQTDEYKFALNKFLFKQIKKSLSGRYIPQGLKNKLKFYYAYSIFTRGDEKIASGEIDSAKYYYEEAQKIFEQLNNKVQLGDCFAQLGYLKLIYEGNAADAAIFYEKSYDLYKAANDTPNIAFALSSLAYIYEQLGDLIKALDYYYKGLALAEAKNDLVRIGIIYNNLAKIYYEQGNLEKALEFFKKAQIYYQKVGFVKGRIILYNNIANIYDSQHKTDSAIFYSQKFVNEAEKFNLLKETALAYRNLARLYVDNDTNLDSAIIYLDKSLQISEQTGDLQNMIYAYATMSKAWGLKKNYQKALFFAQKAYKIAQKADIPELKMQALKPLFSTYEILRDYKNAYEYISLYYKYRDTMRNEKNQQAIIAEQLRYEYEKNMALQKAETDKKLEVEKEKQKRLRLINWFVSIGLILVVFFAVSFYNRWIVSKRQNILIKAQQNKLQQMNKDLEEKSRKITDSIVYAERIQQALLPSVKDMEKVFEDYFIFYKPKEIVSGDFFWIRKKEQFLYVAVADCTGHGVAGAFMSLLGISYLNDIITHDIIYSPAQILEILRDKIKQDLIYEEKTLYDSMDISLLRFNMQKKELLWAGANRPIWIVKKDSGELIEIKGERQTAGYNVQETKFIDKIVDANENFIFYMFSDGFPDQFNTKGQKFGIQRFKKLILEIANFPLSQQKEILEHKFEQWKGNFKQIDDILVLGFII